MYSSVWFSVLADMSWLPKAIMPGPPVGDTHTERFLLLWEGIEGGEGGTRQARLCCTAEGRQTVVDKVDKNVVVRARLQDATGTDADKARSVALEDLDKGVWIDVGAAIVNLHVLVDVGAARLVDDLARRGVLWVVRQVVVHQRDDAVLAEAVGNEDLVGMAGVGLGKGGGGGGGAT